MSEIPNGRTHEPSLREVVAQLDGLKELMQAEFEAVKLLANERDRLYKERAENSEKSVTIALQAQKIMTEAAFASADKAVTKADAAAEKRFDAVNEFREQLSDQAAAFLPRAEFAVQHKSMEDKILSLQQAQSSVEGKEKGISAMTVTLLSVCGIASAIFGGVVGHLVLK
jgi:hypothetical protein